MRRREFIAGLGSAAAWPLVVEAQRPALPVIGFFNPNQPATMAAFSMAAFLEGLKEGGYVDGRNVAIEYRWADGRLDRLPALAADLIRRQVKVLVASGVDATLAAKSATTTIPIVFQSGADPVRAGFVSNLSRPGGNITGVSNFSVGLGAKRLELLHQLVPKAASIGILVDPKTASSEIQKIELQEAANALRLALIFLDVSNEQEIDAAFASVVRQRIGAILLADNTLFNARREQLVTLARFNALPAMYTFREFAAAGGLISYTSSVADAQRRAGNYVARILNGEKPGDLPIQLPSKFELVINLKAAKALGIEVPPSLLAIADEVIE
jgi:putative tryptophan/tyrosine transport system substrate-binding protein